MTDEQFIQFLKGYVSAIADSGPSKKQWKTLTDLIENHPDQITAELRWEDPKLFTSIIKCESREQ